MNRTAANSSGGTPSIPQSITTKLKPHMVATRAASRESRRFTGSSLDARTMQHQQMIMPLSM